MKRIHETRNTLKSYPRKLEIKYSRHNLFKFYPYLCGNRVDFYIPGLVQLSRSFHNIV